MPPNILGLGLLYVGAVLFVNAIYILTDRLSARDTAVINLFTGSLTFLNAIYFAYVGEMAFAGAQTLLFSFTYLWVFIDFWQGREHMRALGWYCLFVAVVAAPVGFYTLSSLPVLGVIWETWAYLWFVFFLFMGLELNIPKLTGWSTMAVALITWGYAFWILQFVGAPA